jgi:hypothetical protein
MHSLQEGKSTRLDKSSRRAANGAQVLLGLLELLSVAL